MNIQLIIHVVVEFVILGAMMFWMHRRLSGFSSKMEDLALQVRNLTQIVSQFQEVPRPQIQELYTPKVIFRKPPVQEEDDEISPDALDMIIQDEIKDIAEERNSASADLKKRSIESNGETEQPKTE